MRRLWPVRLLGLDLGAGAIKTVWLRMGLGGPNLIKTAQADSDSPDLGQVLANLLYRRPRADLEIAGLPGQKSLFRWLNLPPLSGAKLRTAARFGLEDDLPVGLEDMAVDLARLARGPNKSFKGLAFALSRERIASFLALAAEVGWRPQVVSLDAVGLLAAAEAAGVESGAVVDLGAAKTTVLCLSQGRLAGLDFLPTAGHALDRHLARSKGWSMAQARHFKENLSRPEEAASLLGPPLAELCQGIGQVIRAALAQYEVTPSCLYLCGGTSRLPGLSDLLADQLDLPVEYLNPLAGELEPEFVSAAGLALSGEGFNLGREMGLSATPAGQLKIIAALGGLILILAGANIYLRLEEKTDRLNELKAMAAQTLSQNMPQLSRVVSPVAQMETELTKAQEELAALRRGQGEGRILDFLLLIDEHGQAGGVRYQEIFFDGPAISLTGWAENFDRVEALRQALAGEPVLKQVTLESSGRDGSGAGVKFRMKIRR